MKNRIFKSLEIVLAAVFATGLALGMVSCSGDEDSHNHSYSETWSSDGTYHWHWATCEHSATVSGRAGHSWDHQDYQFDSASGTEIRTCTVCSFVDKKDVSHTYSADWSYDSTYHWHWATDENDVTVSGRAEHAKYYRDPEYDSETGKDHRTCPVCKYLKISEHSHRWDHIDYIYNSTSGKDKRTCQACGYVDERDHIHVKNTGTVTKLPTCMNKGVRTFKCLICNEELPKDIEALGWCETALDAEKCLAATSSSKYIFFGAFPKTVKASSVTVNESESMTMGGNTYYKGSDGEWYAKVTAASPVTFAYKYSDGTELKKGSAQYFKVEPIKWKVLSTDYNGTGKALLHANEILTANVPYNVNENTRTIDGKIKWSNNYRYSTLRAYLNGKFEEKDTQDKTAYTDKGFLQTAFTASAQAKIEDTLVDNSKLTTGTGYSGDSYSRNFCENTTDKIFVLSCSELINESYGFAACNVSRDINRIRVTTDYAKANYAYQDTDDGNGGFYWMRSPDWWWEYRARYVGWDSSVFEVEQVTEKDIGVVPALTIELGE